MSLKSAFAKVQKAGGQFYLKLAQLFEENPLIRETWVAMARDMELQAASLEGLPSRFWSMLKSDEEALLGAIRECPSPQAIEIKEDRSLHHCYIRSLDIEEPLILRAYVPVIRLLRTEWSDRALDFYIMVKSHMARISRIIQPFSIDPVLLQRVQNLQQRFEFEVQRPAIADVVPKQRGVRKKTSATSKVIAVAKSRKGRVAARTAKRALPLAKRVQQIVKRGKPLVHKPEITRRRARAH
jgi:hypothetical protein